MRTLLGGSMQTAGTSPSRRQLARTVGVVVSLVGMAVAPAAGQGIATLSCELSTAQAVPSGTVQMHVFIANATDIRGYQTAIGVNRTSGTGSITIPCPSGAQVVHTRSDFLFAGIETVDLDPFCPNCGVIATSCADRRIAAARANGTAGASEGRRYLGSFALRVSADAQPGSTFEASPLPFPWSIVADSANDPIPTAIGPPCVLHVTAPPGIPTLSAWSFGILLLLMLTAATLCLRRIGTRLETPKRARPSWWRWDTSWLRRPMSPRWTWAGRFTLTLSAVLLTSGRSESPSALIAGSCVTSADCADADVCTFDACLGGACINSPASHGDIASQGGCGPDGVLDRFDVLAVRDAFGGFFSAGCAPHNVDIWSDNACLPDGRVDLFDIIGVLKTFAGQSKCGCPIPADPPDQGPPDGLEAAAPCASCRTCKQGDHGIRLFSGEFYVCAPDLRIKGRGVDFALARTYRSKVGPKTAIGNGWDFSYNIRVETSGPNLILHGGNARRDVYPRQPDGTWTRREFFRTIEQEPDGSLTLLFPDTGRWEFHALDGSPQQGRLRRSEDRNGNALTFDYDALGRLTRIHDTLDTVAHNRDITAVYNASGLIESITDFAGRTIVYSYYDGLEPGGSLGDLKSVTRPKVFNTPDFPIPPGHEFPSGKTTTYTYSRGFADERLNHNLLTITDPAGQTCLTNEYHATTDPHDLNFDRLKRQLWGGPTDIIDIVYLSETPMAANNFATRKAIQNDRAGNVKEFRYDARNRLVLLREFTGRADPGTPTTEASNRPAAPLRLDDPPYFETRIEYNTDSLRTRVVYPNGNEERFTYDSSNTARRSQGNLLEHCRLPGPLGGDQASICESFEYHVDLGGCCGTNFVTRHVDGRGNATLHTYDGAGNRLFTQHRIETIVEDFEYNTFGQLTAHTLPDNGSGYRQRNEITYHAAGSQMGYLDREIVDAPGLALTTKYTYNLVGDRIAEIDPLDHDTQYVYNQLGQLVLERSREVTTGSSVRYDTDFYFDANDNLVRIDQLNVNDQGMVESNAHFSTIFDFDCLNNVIRVCQEAGYANLSLSMRSCGEVPSNEFIISEYQYDANRNVALIRDGAAVNGTQPSNTVRLLYDERDLLFREVRAEGTSVQSTTQYDYDGNRIRKAEREGLEVAPRVTTYSTDGYNRRTMTRDAMGNVVTDRYDANGNRVITRSDGELVDLPSDAGNTRLSESTFTYDAMDRLVRTEVAHFDPFTQTPIGDGSAAVETEYTDNSKVRRVSDDNHHATETAYDTANRELVVTDAKGNTRTKSYDANSNVLTITEVEKSDLGSPDQVFTRTSEYDNLDRLILETDNVGNMRQFAYDSRNNRTRESDSLGRETRFEYDGVERPAVTTRDLDGDGADGDGADIVIYDVWDDSFRLVAQVDGNGNATQYAYDALDRVIVTKMADETIHQVGTGAVWPEGALGPDLSGFTSGYDVRDNRIVTTDALGTVVTTSYDLLDRMTARSIVRAPGVGGTTAESYQYDGSSRLIQAADDDSFVNRSHDSMNNITSETLVVAPGPDQTTGTTAATFDGVGNMLSCVYPTGRSIALTYDALDRMSAISDAAGSIATYSYLGFDRVERRTYPASQTDYVYDGVAGIPNPSGDFGVKNIIRTTHSRIADGAILDDRSFRWDAMDNKTQRSDLRVGGPRLTHDYSYDAAYRLTRATVTNASFVTVRDTLYAIDTVGNRTSVVGLPNPGAYTMDPTYPDPADFYVNQYTATPVDGRLYDANGNLTSTSAPVNASYDYRNQLISYDNPLLGRFGYYFYDALGRRIQRITNAFGIPQIVRYFSYGKQEVEEQDSTGTTLATYVYGNYIDEVLTMRRGGIDYYYHGDDLHNVMAVSNSTGSVVERYEYQDYGDPQFMGGAGGVLPRSMIDNPYFFTGRRFDGESRYYYFRSRYLDPIAGRFTTRDPLGIWGDQLSMGNGYAYAGNNPWSAVDPDGHGWFKRLKKKAKKFFERAEKRLKKFAKQYGRLLKSATRLRLMIVGLTKTFFEHMMGERHPPRWNYGEYCGLRRVPSSGACHPHAYPWAAAAAKARARSDVDLCCLGHDCCGTWSILTLGTVGGRRCNETFCACLRDAHCFGDDRCRQFRRDARNLYCLWP